MRDQFKEAFKVEAYELLNNLESLLLELEASPEDAERVSAVFRAMHTIKGSAAMFGFDRIAGFTHEAESVLDLVRAGKLGVTRRLIDLTLRSRDLIRSMLDEGEGAEGLDGEESAIKDAFKRLIESGAEEAPVAGCPDKPHAELEELETTWRISFEPSREIMRNGTKPMRLVEELVCLGEASAVPRTEAIPALEDIDPELCYVSWDVVLTTKASLNSIREVFIFAEDSCALKIDKLMDQSSIEAEASVKRLGEILIERGAISNDELMQAMQRHERLGEVLVKENKVSPQLIRSALAEQEHLRRQHDKQQLEMSSASIRVASEKLDSLVDLVGELVTLQARLAQTALLSGDPQLASLVEQSDRLISQLRDNTMSIRMLPIGSTFSKFRRLVRDLSLEMGKEIELVTEGGDTELDKTVIEKLNDPLVHLIRNAVDHGIGGPEERARAGKPRTGTVYLSAAHSGAFVMISVRDDGRGIDVEAVRAKAVEKGLLAPGAHLSEQAAYELLFAPGFSTAAKVSNVSGRGVGMDVVKKEIDSLGGSVSIESVLGKGSTFTLKIPLTLAIIDGLLVRVGGEHFVIPLQAVDGCIERPARGDGRKVIEYRGELMPFASLRNFFDTPGEAPAIEQIVVCSAHEGRVGLVVDAVIGDYQTVIKPLGRMYKGVEGLSGATILGDGGIALILDVNRLAQVFKAEEESAIAAKSAVKAGRAR
jgi:two-component system chemotaxis sensor kinase CheA